MVDNLRSKQLRNRRDAVKALAARIKEDGGSFDGRNPLKVLSYILAGDEVLLNYRVGAPTGVQNTEPDLLPSDAIEMYFLNMTGQARDFMRGQRQSKPRLFTELKLFKTTLVNHFYSLKTPFEGYAPIY